MTFIQRWSFFIIALILLYMVRGIITPFVIAAILAYLFSPLIDQVLERIHIPRIVAVLAFYVILIGALVVGVTLLSGRLATEVTQLRQQGPDIVSNAVQQFTGGRDIDLFGNTVTPNQIANALNQSVQDFMQTPTGALAVAKSVAEGLLNGILMLLVMFYLLLDGKKMAAAMLRFVPADRRDHVSTIMDDIHKVLGFYLRGQLLLILLVSVVMYLILSLAFNLPFALPIAILSGFLEIIPLVGPALAASIAAIIALATPYLGIGGALWILLTYFIVRQIEDQVVMPLVVGRAVHLHPIITTFAVLAGGAIAGLLGTLLAVPIAAAVNVVANYAFPPLSDEHSDTPQPLLGRAISLARRTAGRNQRLAEANKREGQP